VSNRHHERVGYELEGFVAKLSTLRAWQREVPSLPVCPLDDTLGLVPGERVAELGRDTRACGRKLAEKGMVVFISASEFGDLGGGSAIVWEAGRVTEDVEVNAALRMLGARASPGSDEFETLDLGHNTARWHGAAAVAALPGAPEAALAELAALLRPARRTAVRERAAHELRRFGPPAIPLLVEAFQRDREYGTRLNAACSLAAIGDAGVAALLELLPRTPINDRALPFLSDPAILLLALKGAPDVPASAMPLVVPLLDEPGLRCDAVQLCEAMGPAAAPAVGALAAILTSEGEWFIRSYAVKALAAIGDVPGVAAALEGARRSDEHAEVRRGAEAALKNLGRVP
jgi:HEAT repeat protein